VVDDGRLVLYLERGGRSLVTDGEVQPVHLQALIAVATNAGRVELQKVDGVSVLDSPLKSMLRDAGFSQTHRSLVAYANRR
jgi:ATP-dependent Lhr-like helicase